MRIELSGVAKHFGRVAALDGIDLILEPGSRVALIGPNGSGKSTLTRAIMGIIGCTGTVRVNGVSPYERRVEIAQQMAYVPQIAPQLGGSVAEVIRLISALRRLDPQAVRHTAARLALDLEAIADQPVRALSGGMKQKLLIALAFATDASLLILDEPTASLDAASRQAFFGLVEERAPDATLLLCSHRLDELHHLVDNVVELRSGRVAFAGPVDAFLGAHAYTMIEVRATGPAGAAALRERGFRRGAAGSWARLVSRGEKLSLLRELLAAKDWALEDVLVRDLDTLDSGSVAQPEPASAPVLRQGVRA